MLAHFQTEKSALKSSHDVLYAPLTLCSPHEVLRSAVTGTGGSWTLYIILMWATIS